MLPGAVMSQMTSIQRAFNADGDSQPDCLAWGERIGSIRQTSPFRLPHTARVIRPEAGKNFTSGNSTEFHIGINNKRPKGS